MKDPELPTNELTTNRKALLVNLDQDVYGTFAEIGAGQEVARHFFKVGGAAGTIAKSMSAYDMKFSDSIYGKAARYVSRERLLQMLEHEYKLLQERLGEARGADTTFFVFSNTVATASFSNRKPGHGWLGMRFQIEPGGPPHDILVHARLLDKTAQLQQEALGIFGVNFIWAALVYHNDLDRFIPSLLDHIEEERIEVDMLEFIGPRFEHIENRIVGLKLVENGLTNAVLFSSDGGYLLPMEAFYKKAVLVERGSFRPVTHVNVDMITCAGGQFVQEDAMQDQTVMPLFEITMKNLLAGGQEIDYKDFLARVDTINTLGYPVLVSNYQEYYRLSQYFRRYTDRMVGLVLGINHLQAIFNEEYYQHLEGGILESFGRLFKENVKLYVYPMKGSGYHAYLAGQGDKLRETNSDFESKMLITADNLRVKNHLRHLYAYLLENHFLVPVLGANPDILNIFSRDIIRRIQDGEGDWEDAVPDKVAAKIKADGLWAEKATAAAAK
ncbi:TonB-dependent receptor [Cerasicoccus frondis]|uniref:TonB-dependent receptor n=1 Tax=Cerasicoccus frondis TaxID=490090 RepID=UPI0028527CD0|nr:TonB-dependent receptor [Cerasicoccus frondis]